MGLLSIVIFINDKADCLRNGSEHLCADETKIFRNIKDLEECNLLERDLEEISYNQRNDH